MAGESSDCRDLPYLATATGHALPLRQREERLSRFLEEEIWPLIPLGQLGRPVSKAEREQILGFGEHCA